jgi:hypothetical protein
LGPRNERTIGASAGTSGGGRSPAGPEHRLAGWLGGRRLQPVRAHLAAGRYLPDYGNPLDRWLVAPLLRLLPRRRVEASISRTSLEGTARALDPMAAFRACRTGRPYPRWVTRLGHVAFFGGSDRVLRTARPGSSAPGPGRARKRGRKNAPGWSPRQAAASCSHRQPAPAAHPPPAVMAAQPATAAAGRCRSARDSPRHTARRDHAGAGDQRQPSQGPHRPVRAQHRISQLESSSARAVRQVWKSAGTATARRVARHQRHALASCPSRPSFDDPLSFGEKNDHAEAVLTRSDTPGTPAQDQQTAPASAAQVKRQAKTLRNGSRLGHFAGYAT